MMRPMADHATTRRFVEAMRRWFETELEIPGPPRPKVWVAGGVTRSGEAAILFRHGTGGRIVRRTWDLDQLSAMFSPSDPEHLAECMWESEVDGPDWNELTPDIDGIEAFTDELSAVRWLGPEPDPEGG